MNIVSFMRKGMIVIFIKFFSLLVAMLSSIYVARTLGPSQFGVYAFTVSIISIAAIVSQLGGPQILIREISSKTKSKATIIDSVNASFWLQIFFSSGISLLLGAWLYIENEVSIFVIFLIILSIPMLGNISILVSVARGEKKIIVSQLPEFILKNTLFIVFMMILSLFSVMNLKTVLLCFFLSIAASWFFSIFLIINTTKYLSLEKLRFSEESLNNIGYMFKLTLPFAAMTIAQVMMSQLDIAMLGSIGDSVHAGIYKAMASIGVLALLGQQISGLILAPYMAEKYKQGTRGELIRIYKYGLLLSLLFAILVSAIVFYFGNYIIEVTYGDEFLLGRELLLIIVFGYTLSVVVGPAGMLLNMIGKEKAALIFTILACVINVLGNAIYIPIYGMYGAAITTLITTVIWNYGMFAYAKFNRII